MTVRIEKNDVVWTVIHSRPDVKNAMNPESAKALYDAFLEFDADDSALAAVLWGEGGTFCAGYDLKHTATLSGSDHSTQFDFPPGYENADTQVMGPMGPSRLTLSKPVIAAVSGPAVAGGMELAIWADIRVMELTAYMGVYCRRWGVPLVDGGTVRLPRLVGEGRALDLILTGRKVDASEAHAIGLCEYVVPEGEAKTKAEELAHDIARFPQSCMRSDRRSLMTQHSMSLAQALQNEWNGSKGEIAAAIEGAARFVSGKGRGGDFSDL